MLEQLSGPAAIAGVEDLLRARQHLVAAAVASAQGWADHTRAALDEEIPRWPLAPNQERAAVSFE